MQTEYVMKRDTAIGTAFTQQNYVKSYEDNHRKWTAKNHD